KQASCRIPPLSAVVCVRFPNDAPFPPLFEWHCIDQLSWQPSLNITSIRWCCIDLLDAPDSSRAFAARVPKRRGSLLTRHWRNSRELAPRISTPFRLELSA